MSQEFQIMGNIFYQNKINYLNAIKTLLDEKTQNKAATEEFISMNLDEFIANIGIELFNLPIESLYNIFNNTKRQLTRHNNCYEFIKQHYKQNQNMAIFSILPSLDGKLLSDENLNDSISSQSNRCGYIVKIEFSYILELKKEIEQLKENQNHMQQQISEMKNMLPDPNIGEAGQFAVLNQQKNGYIWKMPPFSIHFKASLNNVSTSYGLPQVKWGKAIPLDKVIEDPNNSFDVNAHAYRIPVAGKWLFFGQLQHNRKIENGFIYCGISKNGSCFCGNGIYKTINQYEVVSCSGEAECQQGDLIYLFVYHETDFIAGRTFIQGFYLSS